MQTTNKPVKRFALAVDDKAIQKLLSDIESAPTPGRTQNGLPACLMSGGNF